MRIAIFSGAGDMHADSVSWGLSQRGHLCDKIFLGDLPQRATLVINPGIENGLIFEGDGQLADLSSYDRVWLRRPADAILPDDMHAADRRIARMSWDCAIDAALWSASESGLFCVNPFVGVEFSRLKLRQLNLARRAGLAVPKTLITSDGDAAREFIRRNEAEGLNTVVKSLYSEVWDLDHGGLARLATVRVGECDIIDESLQLAPYIFQAEVRKRSDVRLTVMGQTVIAADLDSQKLAEAVVDYRLTPDWTRLGCERIDVPPDISEALLRFHRMAGVNFGTLDFVVDPDGRWVFLETNPMGQFLWVEDVNPEIPMLDAFVEFIISGSSDFRYEGPRDAAVSLLEFRIARPEKYGAYLAQERDRHVQDLRPRPVDRSLAVGAEQEETQDA